MKYLYLSYPITAQTPIYGGNGRVYIRKVSSISNGESANSYRFLLHNHCGTHIDAPNHFFNNAKAIIDYPPVYWFFKAPIILEVNLMPSKILRHGSWLNKLKKDNDIVLLKSGWGKYRGQRKYVFNNSGIHPEVAIFLRENYPALRAVGIDWISISSYQNRKLGRKSHKAFLDSSGFNNPLLLIEDMDLSFSSLNLKEIIIMPLRMRNLDSAPCTAIGRFL